MLSYGCVKDWILVHWAISSKYEKYHRDILLKSLVDEKVAVWLLSSYWTFTHFLYRKHQKETADVWVLSKRKHTPPPSCLSVQDIPALLQGRCWLSENGNLEFCYSINAFLSPNRLTMNVNQTNYPCFWKDCTDGLHIELVYAFLCCCVLLKHNFIKIGMLC